MLCVPVLAIIAYIAPRPASPASSRATDMPRAFTPSPEFPAARARYDALQHELTAASLALRAIPGVGSGAMGLTPDDVKASAAFRAARARYQAAHDAARAFNGGYVRTFKRELAAERAAKREAMAKRG